MDYHATHHRISPYYMKISGLSSKASYAVAYVSPSPIARLRRTCRGPFGIPRPLVLPLIADTAFRGSGIHASLDSLPPDGGLHLPPTDVKDRHSSSEHRELYQTPLLAVKSGKSMVRISVSIKSEPRPPATQSKTPCYPKPEYRVHSRRP